MDKNKNIRVIWSHDVDINNWKDYVAEELIPRYCEDLDVDPADVDVDEFMSEHEDYVYDEVYNLHDQYLEDERINLDVPVEGDILVIADVGRWDGRHDGFEILEDRNLNVCLECRVDNSRCTFYVEKEGKELELKAEEIHHDGVNYYTYREVKPDLTETQRDNFEHKLYNEGLTKADIKRYTNPLGQEVQKVYGFTFDKPKQAEREV